MFEDCVNESPLDPSCVSFLCSETTTPADTVTPTLPADIETTTVPVTTTGEPIDTHFNLFMQDLKGTWNCYLSLLIEAMLLSPFNSLILAWDPFHVHLATSHRL